MGGGGGWFPSVSARDIAKLIQDQQNKLDDAEFKLNLAEVLNELLAGYNNRDNELINDRLNDVKEAIKESIEDSISVLFGGSVSKHTYIDGISDVDSLVVLNDSALEELKPQQALDRLEDILNDKISGDVKIEKGSIAISMTFPDGMVLQLLPSLRSGDKLKVPAWERNEWSSIDPNKFKEGLTKRNQECSQKVVPMIKLAKAINAKLPEEVKLTGYHVESLAVAAFRGYEGEKNVSQMLPYFFEKARDLVLKPMTDRTGQSVHVDEYLGVENSDIRKKASQALDRIARRMNNACIAQSVEQWLDLFEE